MHAIIQTNLGDILQRRGKLADAVACYQRALAIDPYHALAHHNLGLALAAQSRFADSIVHYRRALALNPRNPDAHNNIGIALEELNETGDAIAHYHQALSLQPRHAEAWNNLGNALKSLGRFDEAQDCYRRAIALRPDFVHTYYNLSEIKRFDETELAALAGQDNVYAHFALAKAFEDAGDYERAFEHLRRGNALKRSQVRYEEACNLTYFARICDVFDANLRDFACTPGNPSETPIFVVGMPRSGSTLVEQILASHPQIHGAGELSFMERVRDYPQCVPGMDAQALRRLGDEYLAALPAVGDGILRIADKLPGNFSRIGLIRLILPKARIIHTVRDARDTCLSCYAKLFAAGLEFSYDLGELGRYYRGYRMLMNLWRAVLPPDAILDVAYEDVVRDLEGQARRLIAYCGLDWDERCIAFHQTQRTVRTASAAQVRQPVYQDSVGRWRRYEAHLGPLLSEL